MPRFSANLSFLFQELPMLERFQAAATAGFKGAEIMFPYEWPAGQIKDVADAAGIALVLHNFPPGDWSRGERGLASLPGRQADFRASVDLALKYAQSLDVPQLHCMAGLVQDTSLRANQMKVLRENLRYAADQLAPHQINLNLEAINSRVDMPGYFLDTGEEVAELIDELDHPAIRMQFDIYHMQISGGDLTRRLHEWLPMIGHIQFADHPGRHEPGTGEINYPYLFDCLDRWSYTGWVGAEYVPTQETGASLGWLTQRLNKL